MQELAKQTRISEHGSIISDLLKHTQTFFPLSFVRSLFSGVSCKDEYFFDCLCCTAAIVKREKKGTRLSLSKDVCLSIFQTVRNSTIVQPDLCIPLLSLFDTTNDFFFFKAARRMFQRCSKRNLSWTIPEDSELRGKILNFYAADMALTNIDAAVLLQIYEPSNQNAVFTKLSRCSDDVFSDLSGMPELCSKLTLFFLHQHKKEELSKLYNTCDDLRKEEIVKCVCDHILSGSLFACDALSQIDIPHHATLIRQTLRLSGSTTASVASKFLQTILPHILQNHSFQQQIVPCLSQLLSDNKQKVLAKGLAASAYAEMLYGQIRMDVSKECIAILSSQSLQIKKVFCTRLWNLLLIAPITTTQPASKAFSTVSSFLLDVCWNLCDWDSHLVRDETEQELFIPLLLLMGLPEPSKRHFQIWECVYQTISNKHTSRPSLLSAGIECLCKFGAAYKTQQNVLRLFRLLISSKEKLSVSSLIHIFHKLVEEQRDGYSSRGTPIQFCCKSLIQSSVEPGQAQEVFKTALSSFIIIRARMYDLLVEEGEDTSERWEDARSALLELMHHCLSKSSLKFLDAAQFELPSVELDYIEGADLLLFFCRQVRQELVKSVGSFVLEQYMKVIQSLVLESRPDCSNLLIDIMATVKFTHIPLTKSMLYTALDMLSIHERTTLTLSLLDRVLKNSGYQDRLPLMKVKDSVADKHAPLNHHYSVVLTILLKTTQALFKRQALDLEGDDLESSPFFCNAILTSITRCSQILQRELPTKANNLCHAVLTKLVDQAKRSCSAQAKTSKSKELMKSILQIIFPLLQQHQDRVQNFELLECFESITYAATRWTLLKGELKALPKVLRQARSRDMEPKTKKRKKKQKRSENDALDDMLKEEEEKDDSFNDLDGFLVK